MSWMNSSDVDAAVERCRSVSHLRMGALFLRDFMDLIDDISDGWAYWSYGTHCSNDLQELMRRAPCAQRDTTRAQVHAAMDKVATFLRRCKQTRDLPAVHLFLEQHGYVARAKATADVERVNNTDPEARDTRFPSFFALSVRRGCNVPQWAVAVELVARGITNRDWSGWGPYGRRAWCHACKRGALRMIGVNGLELRDN